MKNFVSYLKALLIAVLIWFGVYISTIGPVAAGFAVSVLLLVAGGIVLFMGAILAATMLQRSEDKWLRLALVLLLSVGTVVVTRALAGITSIAWFKGF